MPPFVPRKHERPLSPSLKSKGSNGGNTGRGSRKKKSTLFDTSDSPLKPIPSVNDNKIFLKNLEASEGSSSFSDVESVEFEDVLKPSTPAKRRKLNKYEANSEEEDEMDWEDAIGQESMAQQGSNISEELTGDLELTLDRARTWSSFKNAEGSKKGPSKIERQIRINTHSMHVQSLMFHNFVRNSWTCDEKVQAILRNHLTTGIQKEIDRWRTACGSAVVASESKSDIEKSLFPERKSKFSKINKPQRDWGSTAAPLEEGVPDLSRGDPTIRLLKILSAFWRKIFTIKAPGLRKQGYKSLERLEAEMKAYQLDGASMEDFGERVDDIHAFRDLAKLCKGSRDVGAQLFTALVRSIGLEARFIASLQPIGFSWTKMEEANETINTIKTTCSNKATSNKSMDTTPIANREPQFKKTNSGAAKDEPIDISSDDSELSSIPSSQDESMSAAKQGSLKASQRRYDRDLPFPVYWTEVLSPISNKWIPTDSIVTSTIANNEEQLVAFEPRGARADKAKQIIAYVVAFSQDHTAKEVTTRYLKRHMWPGKTKGVRTPIEKIPIYNKRGKIKKYQDFDWFQTVMSNYTKQQKSRNLADDIEDATDLLPVKIEKKPREGLTETLQGYKNSAEFVLERHLRREEALLPEAAVVKTFMTGKGTKAKEEAVYRRADVVVCKTIESWHKEGREIKPGSQALKHVPMRAVTLLRKREIEEVERDTGEKMKQPLYSKVQTDWIIPPPIENGVIPKNAFGNIDIYVKSMVPKGAVHLPLKGAAKICRKLEINYAEACTGFEFGHQRAIPVLTGVVVAIENKNVVVNAWRAAEEEKRKKAAIKREKAALTMWRKLFTGLKIVEDLIQKYGEQAGDYVQDAIHPMSQPNLRKRTRQHQAKYENQEESMAEGYHEIIAGSTDDNLASEIGDSGGFVRGTEELEIADDDAHGGGFLPDTYDSNLEKIAPHYRNPRKPMSLRSLHQRKKSNESLVLSDDEVSSLNTRHPEADSEPFNDKSQAAHVGSRVSPDEETAVTKSPYFVEGIYENLASDKAPAPGTKKTLKSRPDCGKTSRRMNQ